MDLIALLKTERDKVAWQLNALNAVIRALSGLDRKNFVRKLFAVSL